MADQYSQDQIYQAMRAADAAGDGEAVKALAAQLGNAQPQRMSSDQFIAGLRDKLKTAKSLDEVHQYVAQSGYHDTGNSVDQAYGFLHGAGRGYQGQYPVNVGGDGAVQTQSPFKDGGMLDTGIRAIANGVTGGWADKIAAAADAVIPLDQGSQSIWGGHTFADAYAHNKAIQSGVTQADAAANPGTNLVGTAAGAIASPTGKLGLAGDALYGLSYGAGQSNADNWKDQGIDAVKGGAESLAGGYLGGKLMQGAGKVVQGVTDPVKRALADSGVTMTPGQLAGGWLASTERKLTSEPIGGPSITQRLADSGESWWKSTIGRALEPLGKTVPDHMTGQEATAFAKDAFDNAFGQARQGLQFAKTPDYEEGLAALQDQIKNGGTDSLSDVFSKRFNNVLKNTVQRRIGEDGTMDGNALKTVQAALGKEANKYAKGADADGREYASKISALKQLIDDAAMSNPNSSEEAKALMAKANEGFRLYALARQAAKRGATDEVGTATPFQYLQAVKGADRSVDKQAFSTGNAFDQQYAQDSVKALGKALPNSQTADRAAAMRLMGEVGLGALADQGLGYAGVNDHHAGLGLALGGGLALKGLYSQPVNAFIQRAVMGGPARAKIGQQINDFANIAGRIGAGSVPAIAQRLSVPGAATLSIQDSTP